ncbi:histone deacetylase 5-like isoform X2 [Malus sylvestris]|uniref:histone deacetylase 5-like isoform X2 n=1 Tax=Malus sylvestris TaxID=3752 RepID=UPI0021AC4A9A|nr:histone deacetylase 5-like isoform X2 [Malus sylvestris]
MEVAEDIDCENKSQQQKRTRRVGLLYDERMCKHSTPDGDPHPENPNRIKAIWNKLQSAAIPQRCVVLEAKEAEDKHILSVHTKKHVDLIRNISSKQFNSRRNRIASKFNSIYLNEGSSEAAYLAAGSAIEVAERVAKGELDSAMAIIRPPGHHAEQDEAMGFCLYNNVAIAASVLLNEKPELGINKILIVDWDVHHGNGTQKMFWKDPRVLFFSVHRHEFGSFYPANGDGFYTMIGEGPGAGYNINVPWENGRCGDADYFAVWDHILVPVAKEFNPDLIIVSAGFDAAAGDPLGGCRVTPYGYAVMLKKLMSFANGKIVLALEGGYNLESIASSTLSCVEVLLDDNPIHGSSEAYPFESTWRVIQAVRRKLSAFWPSLADKLPETLTNQTTPPASENESEVPSLVRCPRSTELPTTSPQSAVEAAGHVNPPAAEVGSGHEATPLVEPEAKAEMLVHPQNQNLIPPQEVTSTFVPNSSFHRKFYAPKGVIYISWSPQWPLNVDNLHRLHEFKSCLKHWARPLSSLGSSNELAHMVEVFFRQPSWEVELNAFLSNTYKTVRPSATVAESSALAKLQELLCLSASQILQRKGLDYVGECLNDLATDGFLSNESVVHLSIVLERTRQYFITFERALQAEDDLKAAMVTYEAIQPELEAIKGKNERLANLDRQIVEL